MPETIMKNKVQESHSTNIQTLKEVLMKLWVHIDAEYFRKFAESMPNILHNVFLMNNQLLIYFELMKPPQPQVCTYYDIRSPVFHLPDIRHSFAEQSIRYCLLMIATFVVD